MPIKILFFIESIDGGGAEKVLRNLVNNMNQTKFDITVQTVWPCDGRKYLADGIKYKSVYSANTPANHKRFRFDSVLGTGYLFHVKKNYDIEIAYLECGTTKFLASSTNRSALKLAWIHCDIKKRICDEINKQRTENVYKKYDRLVCVSKDVEKSVADVFGNEFTMSVIHNVVDDKEIKEKAMSPLPDVANKRKMTLVSIGRLTYQKNFLRLLKVHKKLSPEYDYDLWILGEGDERETLEKYISDNNLQESVKLLGFCANPYPYINIADLLVCSSLYEGISTFITEGLILGKPIVTTDCTGMRELLGDSEYGLITEMSDDGLYEGMKKMLSDEKLRKHYEEQAKIRGKDFSTETLCRRNEEFLIEALEEKRNKANS